jgi:hypothetical protein
MNKYTFETIGNKVKFEVAADGYYVDNDSFVSFYVGDCPAFIRVPKNNIDYMFIQTGVDRTDISLKE